MACTSNKHLSSTIRTQNAQQDLQTLSSTDRATVQKVEAEGGVVAPKSGDAAKTEMQEQLRAASIDLSKPLGLNDAVAYALTYNLEALVAAQERRVRDEMVSGALFKLLPSLVVSAEESWKSQDTPSFSRSYESGDISLEPSISSDLRTETANAELSWDLLNLTVNIFRWRQAGLKYDISGQQLRRIKQNIALDVIQTWLRAAVARDIAARAEKLLAKAEKRQRIIMADVDNDRLPPIDGLQNHITVEEMRLRATSYANEYASAKAKLAEMLGLLPQTGFEIADIVETAEPVTMDIEMAAFEQEALNQRPELFERDMEVQVNLDEANIAMARYLPAVTPFVRFTHDSNSYLLRHDWMVTGLRLSWDLLSIPSANADRQAALKRVEQERMSRMKLTLAVLTQLRLAAINFKEAKETHPITLNIEQSRKRLWQAVNEQVKLGKLKETLLLEEDSKYLEARRRRLNAYSELVIAKARLENTMGRDWTPPGLAPGQAPEADSAEAPAESDG